MAFWAILEGAAPERLPAALTARMASGIGNQAMLEILSRADGGQGRPIPAFPAAAPATEAAEWTGGAAASEAGAPAFSSLSVL